MEIFRLVFFFCLLLARHQLQSIQGEGSPFTGEKKLIPKCPLQQGEGNWDKNGGEKPLFSHFYTENSHIFRFSTQPHVQSLFFLPPEPEKTLRNLGEITPFITGWQNSLPATAGLSKAPHQSRGCNPSHTNHIPVGWAWIGMAKWDLLGSHPPLEAFLAWQSSSRCCQIPLGGSGTIRPGGRSWSIPQQALRLWEMG